MLSEKGIEPHGEYTGLIETLVVEAKSNHPAIKLVAKKLNSLVSTFEAKEIST